MIELSSVVLVKSFPTSFGCGRQERLDDLVVMAGNQHTIPFRTRLWKSPAPMVLRLDAWESRSLPGLLIFLLFKTQYPTNPLILRKAAIAKLRHAEDALISPFCTLFFFLFFSSQQRLCLFSFCHPRFLILSFPFPLRRHPGGSGDPGVQTKSLTCKGLWTSMIWPQWFEWPPGSPPP